MADNEEFLPADAARATVYVQKNFTECKVLLPDGSVVPWMPTQLLGSLVPESYDQVDCSYTGANMTGVVYKKNGAVIATLVLTYDGSNNLTSIQRT